MSVASPKKSAQREKALVSTPLGSLTVRASERGLTQIDLAPSGETAQATEPAAGSILAEAVQNNSERFLACTVCSTSDSDCAFCSGKGFMAG